MTEQQDHEHFVVRRDGDLVILTMTSEAASVFSTILKRAAHKYARQRSRTVDIRESKKLGLRNRLLSQLSAALRIKARAAEKESPPIVFFEDEESD